MKITKKVLTEAIIKEADEVNAFASGEKELCVYTGLLNYVDDDA